MVIGAGLGGLTLARILQHQSPPIPVTIYERDASPHSRPQGGTLDMHIPSGQKALKLAGLHEKFEAVCSREADTMVIRGKDGIAVFDDKEFERGPPPGLDAGSDAASGGQGGPGGHPGGGPGGPGGPGGEDEDDESGPPPEERPEIDRGVLRQILLDSLEPGTIKWGHNLRDITPTKTPNGTPAYNLLFNKASTGDDEVEPESSNVETETVLAEYVVGADGAWSKVRSILSPGVMPQYTGVSMIECELLDVDSKHPSVVDIIGKGSMLALANNKGIITQRNSGGRVKVYLTIRVPQNWLDDTPWDFSDPEAARKGMLSVFDGWSDTLKDVIHKAQPNFIPRPLVCLEPGFSWEHKKGVTLLGDAAHVMSPFAGEGANLAMLDAAQLALALGGRPLKSKPETIKQDVSQTPSYKNVDDAITQFEKIMTKRSAAAAEESAKNLELFISEGAPLSAANMMKEMMSSPPPPGR
jgi:2-polyprenyl-6-methoxyphenol hydroxylase-like FAD-dependent oxidoreductase